MNYWEIEQNDHIGGREEQQDHVATFSAGNTHLLIVADGLGGHKGGRLASQIVIKLAEKTWDKYQQGKMVKKPKHFLQRICELAHQEIKELGKQARRSPRSTCVLLYIRGKKAWWAHIGDSRLYHFRGRKLLLRTRDHSIVQMLADLGQISEAEMANHPDQGRLLKTLGGKKAIEPDFGQTSVRYGDSFVLCSDGFWEHIVADKIPQRLLQTDFPIKTRVKQLVKDVLDAGGIEGDNIAVAVAHLEGKNRFNTYLTLGFFITTILGLGVWYYWDWVFSII